VSAQSFFRWSGWLLLIGGIISALFAVLEYRTSPPFGIEVPAWQEWIGAVGGLFIILGMPTLYEVHMRKLKAWGRVGFILLLLGLLLEQVLFNIVMAVAGNLPPLLFQNVQMSSSQTIPPIPSIPPVYLFVGIMFVLGVFLFLIGSVLFGIAMALARVFPRWSGWSLVITAVLAVCGSSQNIISNTISTVTAALFALTLSWIGYILAFQMSQRLASETGQTTSSSVP
jgi:hypothetical protein